MTDTTDRLARCAAGAEAQADVPDTGDGGVGPHDGPAWPVA